MGAAAGAGVGGVIGAVAGVVVGAVLQSSTGGDSREGVRRAVAAWKRSHPGFDRAPDDEILYAIDASNNARMGFGATLGTLLGAIIGARVGSPSTPAPGTGASGLPASLPGGWR